MLALLLHEFQHDAQRDANRAQLSSAFTVRWSYETYGWRGLDELDENLLQVGRLNTVIGRFMAPTL